MFHLSRLGLFVIEKNEAVNPGPSYSYLENEAVPEENEGESRPVVLGEIEAVTENLKMDLF